MKSNRFGWPALLLGALAALPTVAWAGEARPGSDPAAVELARETIDRMGGADAWARTRYLQWNFLGRRRHAWDKWTGDARIETDQQVILMNVNSREGRAWNRGEDGPTEVTDPEARKEALELGYACWVNDSYWLIMPFKLLDPGVNLTSAGEDTLPDGRAADVIELTFDGEVGLTPENKYRVWIARDNGLVEQWAYYESATNAEPDFTRPWTGWKRFGEVLIATDHGRNTDWEIAAPAELPRSLFEAP